jgi:phosphopantothenoylcysteine decarboxylase/phosphopantothenate--cysteine ligase
MRCALNFLNARRRTHDAERKVKPKNIILGVTASIAIYKACEIIRLLLKGSICLSVVMTENATRLMSPQVFASLAGGRVYPLRPKLQFAPLSDYEIGHISLAKNADLVLIVPATANIIGKIANGIADDLLSTTVMATRAPVLIAPAMNENMYKNKIVQANIQKLKSLGYKFIEPIKGKLACGDVGVGHLAEVETIVREARRLLK